MPVTTRQLLGADLSRIRQLAGLTGREMAAAIGISQPKLSRVENGQAVLNLNEVKAWCAATAADEPTTTRLVQLVELAFTESLPWRGALDEGRTHLQDDAQDIEASARTIRVSVNNLLPGLLQTAAYARALFPLVTTDLDGHDHEAAVAARMRRQEILYDPSRKFEFLIAESALRWQPGSPEVMTAAITKIMNVAALDNVNIGILEYGSATGPWDSFTLYEDRDDDQDSLVTTELPHTRLILSDQRDVTVYRNRFASWSKAALTNAVAIEWLDELRRDETRPTPTPPRQTR